MAGKLALPQAGDWENAGMLSIRFFDPHGQETMRHSWPLKTAAEHAATLLPPPAALAVSARPEGSRLVLSANGTDIALDTASGQLVSVRHNGQEIPFNNGPLFDTLMGRPLFKSLRHYPQGQDYVVEALYDNAVPKGGKRLLVSLTYTMLSGGWLKIACAYLPAQGRYPFLGFGFQVPEEAVRSVSWLGGGPYRVWKNRLKGAGFGHWSKKHNKTVTGETLWDYPEFKGWHSQLYWARLETASQPVTLVSATDGLFLHLFNPDMPQGAYNRNTDGVFPAANGVSLMHAVSPIGTKFKQPTALGPQGQDHQVAYHGNKHYFEAVVYLGFGDAGN